MIAVFHKRKVQMDIPASAPAGPAEGSLIAPSGVVHGRAEKPAYLHHAGSPWLLALTALGVVFGDIGT
ncbi:MAG: putative potassium transport system protein kup, partial [Tardiphaga sp.]|nr:putative potassium transport system protein kup [Tardiphaga sp.]